MILKKIFVLFISSLINLIFKLKMLKLYTVIKSIPDKFYQEIQFSESFNINNCSGGLKNYFQYFWSRFQ